MDDLSLFKEMLQKREAASAARAVIVHLMRVRIPRTLPFQRCVREDQQERAAVLEHCATQFRARNSPPTD
jgi:hypothetical protein